jgi:GAF domain-containing protein/HAMP domain-containing protein
VVLTFLALIFLWYLARQIVHPLQVLTDAAEAVSQGDLTVTADVHSNDEAESLANTFNSMTSQLRTSFATLEQRVAERTADLAEATRQSEKRAGELKTVSEVARAVSTEVNLESLLTLVTNLVSEQFSFYHVGIFLPDDLNQYAVLRASNSPGGKRMIARGHKLPVGQVGIVGYVAASHEARIALNVGEDAAFFNNPDLPETRSEMALPLRLRGRVIGVLDVQSVEANAFTEKDVETIGILADQIAIAIENTRLLAESKLALAESQSLYGEYVGRTWERKTAQSAIGYYHTAGAGHLISEPVEWDEVQNVLKTGRLVVTTPSQKSQKKEMISAVAVPIRLQNQVIGILDIRSADPDRTWTEDEIAVIEATAERLALALENARLFEETSGRAVREHAVAEITSKIRNTNDPQVMIRTAIEELQRVLGASRVEIVPQVVSTHLPGRESGNDKP